MIANFASSKLSNGSWSPRVSKPEQAGTNFILINFNGGTPPTKPIKLSHDRNKKKNLIAFSPRETYRRGSSSLTPEDKSWKLPHGNKPRGGRAPTALLHYSVGFGDEERVKKITKE